MKKFSVVAIVALAAVLAAHADSINVGQVAVWQSGGFSTVLLTPTGNPTIGPTLLGSAPGLAATQVGLLFEAAILAPPTPTLSNWTFTLSLSGLGTFATSNSFPIFCFPGTNCQWDMWGNFTLPRDIYGPLSGTMDFTFNGVSSGKLPFTYVAPVPEPSTLLLFTSGAFAIGAKIKKRLIPHTR